ncbi:EAL domain-containing protein [Sphingomonas edaphi]|uniref:EAL domain-containing protein n=1 Tax=Sphingomonas edaphi TaxID=2315689 RepID=A0A418PYI9_9SPHN|nr:EAL domain-containing protein [Sphingomonas edaphi]RIX27059.1 EAL domain-containing protein [Sphingomonas edaphi]
MASYEGNRQTMAWLRRREGKTGPESPAKLLAWTIGLGLLFGVIGAGEYVEDRLRVVRNHINERPASGEIVLVSINDKSLREVHRWPWPRDQYAQLITRIDAAQPAMQLHDIILPDRTELKRDRVLVAAAAESNHVYFAALNRAGAREGTIADIRPFPELEAVSRVGSILINYNYANEIWRIPYRTALSDKSVPSFAAILAGKEKPSDEFFRIDYTFDVKSIPVVSASDVLAGRVPASFFRGKKVVVGTDAERIGDQYLIPGRGKYGGVYVHIFAAETLLRGSPIDLGWLPGFILAALLSGAAVFLKGRRGAACLATGVLLLLALPLIVEPQLIFVDVTAGLFVAIWTAAGLGLRYVRSRGLTNPVSGLPNLVALRRAKHERDRAIIVARVVNYPQIVSTLSLANERHLAQQIVSRLNVGSEVDRVYQGDEGIFAWTVPAGTAIGHHIEALHALFRSPAKIAGKPIDVAVSFGVEIGSGRSIANRLGSALVAADEATAEGLRWKYHDPERLKDAEWRLSLLSQLDQAIDDGQVWVAYQPQLDLRTNTIRGAEALARWTHPEKGPISPTEFIAAAEQNDRIEKLTLFVLDTAVAAAARLNQEHSTFDMAVNLSARMLTDKTLPSKVKAILDRHKLDPKRLTLELTETATLASAGDLASLFGLRDLGVRISIDDYGTGLSTLEYLKKIPADEIKIDQTFVKSMRDHRSDLVMVQSTIVLAHSLGRTVVAEGIETREILDMLIAMKCEVGQGFIIGRPSSLNDLIKRLLAERKRRAA